MIRLARIGDSTGAIKLSSELSSLLTRLNAYSDVAVAIRPPSPSEAMAVYTVAARLAQLQLAHDPAPEPADTATTREVLRGVRRLLRAALDRVERDPTAAPRLVVLEGGAAT